MNARIKIQRAGNTTDRQDQLTAHPLQYEHIALFNPQSGFASFLLPAVLMLIIQQTLILGVGMEAGTRRERMEQTHRFPPTDDFTLDAQAELAASEERHKQTRAQRVIEWFHPRRTRLRHASRRAWRNLLGRSAAFFMIYIPVAAFEWRRSPLVLVPSNRASCRHRAFRRSLPLGLRLFCHCHQRHPERSRKHHTHCRLHLGADAIPQRCELARHGNTPGIGRLWRISSLRPSASTVSCASAP